MAPINKSWIRPCTDIHFTSSFENYWKHITKHPFAFLNKCKVLHKSQSGIRKNHSCNTALINLVDKRLKRIDNGEIVGAISFDLCKAFDVVDHDLLLQKLSCSSLNWIKSYLSNRKQCNVEKNKRSNLQLVKSGVPQGSVLGHVLFSLSVNDLQWCWYLCRRNDSACSEKIL